MELNGYIFTKWKYGYEYGGGTTDIAVISLGGAVVSDSIKIGGDKFDAAISAILRKHNLLEGMKCRTT